MEKPTQNDERDEEGESQWKDEQSFIGLYCAPSLKERAELVAEARRQSISETMRQVLRKNLPGL